MGTQSFWPRNASWSASLFGPGVTVGSDIIYPALRIAGVLDRPGHAPNPETTAEALAALNVMLNLWNTERLVVLALQRTLFTLTPSKQDYTIGPSGADWIATQRPQRIDRAGMVVLTNPAKPLELTIHILTLDEWRGLAIKNVPSAIVTQLYYDPGGVPLGTVHLWPNPSVAHQIALYLRTRLAQFSALTDTFVFAAGYQDAIIYNLAVRLAHLNSTREKMAPHAVETARLSKAQIKRVNTPQLRAKLDPALAPNDYLFNIYSGE